jgi:hypothetical protein
MGITSLIYIPVLNQSQLGITALRLVYFFVNYFFPLFEGLAASSHCRGHISFLIKLIDVLCSLKSRIRIRDHADLMILVKKELLFKVMYYKFPKHCATVFLVNFLIDHCSSLFLHRPSFTSPWHNQEYQMVRSSSRILCCHLWSSLTQLITQQLVFCKNLQGPRLKCWSQCESSRWRYIYLRWDCDILISLFLCSPRKRHRVSYSSTLPFNRATPIWAWTLFRDYLFQHV